MHPDLGRRLVLLACCIGRRDAFRLPNRYLTRSAAAGQVERLFAQIVALDAPHESLHRQSDLFLAAIR